MTVRNATELVVMIENTLGWTPPDDKPLWKARAIEAGKINKQMQKDPKKVTFENLELAVEYSRRKRLPVKHPVTVVWRIDKALEEAEAPDERTDLQKEVDLACAHELSLQRMGFMTWVTRLQQAQGPGRRVVLDEWRKAGRDA